MARNYLANHYRGIYYVEPHNRLEQEQNEDKLEALWADQIVTLRELFKLNADVFNQLADTPLEMRTVGRDDILPFLTRLKLPNVFPIPFVKL